MTQTHPPSLARRIVILAVLAAVTAAAVWSATRLVVNDDPMAVFASSDPRSAQLEAISDEFGLVQDSCIVMLTGEEIFSSDGVAMLRELVRRVRGVEGVRAVDSLVGVPHVGFGLLLLPPENAPAVAYTQARENALRHAMIGDQLLSLDGQTTLVLARLDEDRQTVPQIEPVVEQLRQITRELTAGTAIRGSVTGGLPMRTEIVSTLQHDAALFGGLSFLLAGVVMILLYRNWYVLVAVAAAPALAIVWTIGGMVALGEPVTLFSFAFPMVVMAIGLCNTVSLLARGPNGRRRFAVLLSLTTALGMASLALSEVTVVRQFGLSCAAGIALSIVTAWAIAAMLPAEPFQMSSEATAGMVRRRWIAWLPSPGGHGAFRGSYLLAGLGLLIMVGAVVLAVRLKPDYRLPDSLPADNATLQTLYEVSDKFGGYDAVCTVIQWSESQGLESPEVMDAIRQVHNLMEDSPATHSSLSVVNLLECMPAGGNLPGFWVMMMRQFFPANLVGRVVQFDSRRALVTARIDAPSVPDRQQQFAQLKAELGKLEAEHPGLTIRATGTAVVSDIALGRMARDLPLSLAAASLLVLVVAIYICRSLAAGAVAVVCSVFPVAVAAAIPAWMGRPLDMAVAIVLCQCWGMGASQTLGWLNLLRGADSQPDSRERIIAFGSAMTAINVALVVSFACLVLSEVPMLRLVGGLLTAGTLSAWFAGRLLVPSLSRCLGWSR